MKYRTVVMYMEIGCFVTCLCGWILVCSTLPTEYWTFSEVGSIVLTTSNYYSNLWMDCISDTTGVSDCKYYPSMLALPAFLHVCRALAVCSVIFGFFGGVLTLIGMKCTKIGGSELANARVTFAGAMTYLVSGKNECWMFIYIVYVYNISPLHSNVKNLAYFPFRILWYGHLFMVDPQSCIRILESKFQSTEVSTF
uniref:Claudin n=1 Tax=Lates calcarifer TaxID=8187 RepID=A0A4W6DIW5_LATCA